MVSVGLRHDGDKRRTQLPAVRFKKTLAATMSAADRRSSSHSSCHRVLKPLPRIRDLLSSDPFFDRFETASFKPFHPIHDNDGERPVSLLAAHQKKSDGALPALTPASPAEAGWRF
ncbi:hypothetical protein BHE74_00055889 [Ensete ventricosum]|nr:hypothetical protein BHE74_00055889 [Ensete ventricosum]